MIPDGVRRLKVGHVIKNDVDVRVVNGSFKQAMPIHVLTYEKKKVIFRTGIKH